MTKSGIYKITNGEKVPKWYTFFRGAPEPLFFLILLLLMVADSESESVVNDGMEKKTFILFLPRDDGGEEDKEGNDGIHHLFFRYPL